MNLSLEDIVKTKLQKFLDAGFIFPISDSEWVHPLVIVPKKWGGAEGWQVCVDYQELNKATWKDCFLLPFIDQVPNSLFEKKYFSFLDEFSRYNQIQIALEN